MKNTLLFIPSIVFLAVSTTHAIDDFNVQMSKILHEDTSLSYAIYTKGTSAELWELQCGWLQKPSVALRFNATHQEWIGGFASSIQDEFYSPSVDMHFQTIGQINMGLVYSHGFLFERQLHGVFATDVEGDMDSGGVYLSRQFGCGFKAGATWSYSAADLRFAHFSRSFYEFNTMGVSGNIGFARSFGDKATWKNVFVDSSANFLYQSKEDAWYFLWMAKVGHNCCERFAAYGLFNLFHEMDYRNRRFTVPQGCAGYRPYGDDTWGEVGGGFQAQICHGLTFTAEATTPILNEGIIAVMDAFQVRGGLNWSF